MYVPMKESVDLALRGRVAAWLNFKMRQNRLNIKATADLMGVSPAAVSRVSSGARTAGIDFAVAMSKAFTIPLEVLVTANPPISTKDGTAPLVPPLRRKSE